MSDEISLFALMDSHLSKTRLSETITENHVNIPGCHASNFLLPAPPGPRLHIPNFFPENTPMKDFVAERISNTLKAKEKRKQEEDEVRKIEEEMKRMRVHEKEQISIIDKMAKMKLQEEQEYIIDLTSAIIQQPKPNPNKKQVPQQDLSTKDVRPKLGYIFTKLPMQWDKETCRLKPWNPNLSCTTDLSFILKQKVKRGKCSNFGKILCSREWPIRFLSIPHVKEKVVSNIVQFDFKTKSPGDIFKENQANQRKPKMSTRWTVDILDFINTQLTNKS